MVDMVVSVRAEVSLFFFYVCRGEIILSLCGSKLLLKKKDVFKCLLLIHPALSCQTTNAELLKTRENNVGDIEVFSKNT